MSQYAVGALLRNWRTARRRSPMDLALDAGVSPRHLSFVENGRSTPSPQLILTLAACLDVPLRERNAMLLAAGYAPQYRERSLDDPAMHTVREALQRLLDAHDPYPGVVLDRQWNVVMANSAALALTADLPEELLEPPMNVHRICLHPEGLASRTLNLAEWAGHLLGQLRRSVILTGDENLWALAREIAAYPHLPREVRRSVLAPDEPPILVSLRLRVPDGELALFTTLTTSGTPRDITLDELAVELFYPADDETRRRLP